MIHYLKQRDLYPQLHQWKVNPEKLNVFSKKLIIKGDQIVIRDQPYQVVDINRNESPNHATLLQNATLEDTRFYELTLRTIEKSHHIQYS